VNDIYTILIADDDQDDVEMLHDAFLTIEPLLHITIAKSGKDALRFLQNDNRADPLHLIVLDYNMPDLTGAEVLDMISNNMRYKDTPKVIWSTSNSEYYQKRCKDKGATVFFQKPMSVSGLNEMAKEMIALAKI